MHFFVHCVVQNILRHTAQYVRRKAEVGVAHIDKSQSFVAARPSFYFCTAVAMGALIKFAT